MGRYIRLYIISFLMACLLMACSNDTNDKRNEVKEEENTNKQEVKENDQESEETSKTGENQDDWLDEATAVNNNLDSYTTVREKTTVETYNGDENHLYAVEETDIIFSPYQYEMKISQEQLDDSDFLEKDFYDMEGGIYLVDGISYILLEGDTWQKNKVEYTEEELQEQDKVHLDKQIQEYRSIAIDEAFEETAQHYIITFELDPVKVAENDQAIEEKEVGMKKEGYKVNEMNVEVKVNKDTLYVETVAANKSYAYEQEHKGESREMVIQYEDLTTYKNQNEVKEIVVPDEILDSAEEI